MHGTYPAAGQSALKLAVTGATGFVGSAVVIAAIGQGHQVRALLRRGRQIDAQPWVSQTAVSAHAVGLEDSPDLVAALRGVDVVIHVAAALEGDYAHQYANSVTATEQLIGAMRKAQVRRLVGISSFAVYDYTELRPGSVLDENTPIEAHPESRSVYARIKCLQDALFRDFASQPGCACTVLRPGIVYDENRLWGFSLGRALGSKTWLTLGPDAPIPLVHIADVASAILLAASRSAEGSAVFNLVEDAPPQRMALIKALNAAAATPKNILRFAWPVHRALARIASALMRMIGLRGHLPGLLDPVELAVRFKALEYENARARQVLGWRPQQHALLLAQHL